MLDWVVGPAMDIARRKVRRDSSMWRVLARAWAAWRACEAVFDRNPLVTRKWKRRESEFDGLLEQLSRATDDFFVIQVGACDGLMDDPIHDWITKYNWHGILVEPQRTEFERLESTYREESGRLVFENVAIAAVDGMCTLYRVTNSALLADWERGIASLLPQSDPTRFTADTVPCITFDTLLNRHRVSRIDLLQVDVEGYDFEILKLLDFGRLRPALIRYEHRHLSPSDKRACKAYLKRHGYRLLEMKFDTGAIVADHDL